MMKVLVLSSLLLASSLFPSEAFAWAVTEKTLEVGGDIVKEYEPWQLPVEGFRLTQKYSPIHTGLDLATATGSEIRPVRSGTVIRVERKWYGYGFNVIVKHDEEFKTLYAHMSKILVDEGQSVDKQTVLGLSGSTGLSTGPHLHLEVIKGDRVVNPMQFLKI